MPLSARQSLTICDRACDYSVGVDAHLFDWIICLEQGFLQIFLLECISVDDDRCVWFGKSVLGLKSGRIHCHKNVALVARGEYLAGADVYLIARYTCQ